MSAGHHWRGRRGPVLLGPTQHRVARYLEAMTRHGRVTLRMARVAEDLRITRSEAYRITAQLRVLGLFGVENDLSRRNGGRRWWRTARTHDTPGLDAARHRVAWARVRAWCRAELARRLHTAAHPGIEARGMTARGGDAGASPPRLFRDLFRAAGGGPLLDSWGITP